MIEKVLLVDDEPLVLASARRNLGRRFSMEVAEGGVAGLETLQKSGPFAVVVSDLRMPGMDGVEFLARAGQAFPDTVRIMLTGHADLGAATAAVNEGKIFRFLTKPCLPDHLARAIEDALIQHRLIVAEKQLLEQTLSGAVEVLTEVLGLVNPVAFGKTMRIRRLVQHACRELKLKDPWKYDLAAMLSQLGCVTLPSDTLEKVFAGQPLTPDEAATYREHPGVAARLIARIPRLEGVASMIAGEGQEVPEGDETTQNGAWLLKAACRFDELLSQGFEPCEALSLLKGPPHAFPEAILRSFGKANTGVSDQIVRTVSLRDLNTTMILDEDVHACNGLLLAVRGTQVTIAVLEKLRTFARGVGVQGPLRVRSSRVAQAPAVSSMGSGGAE